MNPIPHLLQEHREIMAQVADLREAARALARGGDSALPEALPVLGRFGEMMETKLALHTKKEDEGLFPAMEAIFGTEHTPVVVMRLEHAEIHEQGELFRQTLSQLQQVEHPAIEASGETLRALIQANAGSAGALWATARDLVELLDRHFAKEEQVLFPMAEALLDAATLARVGEMIEAWAAPRP